MFFEGFEVEICIRNDGLKGRGARKREKEEKK